MAMCTVRRQQAHCSVLSSRSLERRHRQPMSWSPVGEREREKREKEQSARKEREKATGTGRLCWRVWAPVELGGRLLLLEVLAEVEREGIHPVSHPHPLTD